MAGFDTYRARTRGLAALAVIFAFFMPRARGRSTPQEARRPPGEQEFVSDCSMCHGMDGQGGAHAPDIASSAAALRLSRSDLERIIENGIPQGGMPSFRTLGPERIQSVIEYLRFLQGIGAFAVARGNPERGKALFFGSAGCSECHMVAGKGGFLGPDLSAYGLSHSPRQIRGAIVEPANTANYSGGEVVAVTHAGQKFVGIARNEDNFSVQLQTPDGRFHLLMKSDLSLFRHERRSLMPADYGARLSKTELDDLAAYLSRSAQDSNSRWRLRRVGAQPNPP